MVMGVEYMSTTSPAHESRRPFFASWVLWPINTVRCVCHSFIVTHILLLPYPRHNTPFGQTVIRQPLGRKARVWIPRRGGIWMGIICTSCIISPIVALRTKRDQRWISSNASNLIPSVWINPSCRQSVPCLRGVIRKKYKTPFLASAP